MTQTTAPTPLSLADASELADLFGALSDPTRVRIIAALMEGETGVGELVERAAISKSAISHQLRRLRDKRIIRTRKHGRHVFVRIDDEHVAELFQRGLAHIEHR